MFTDAEKETVVVQGPGGPDRDGKRGTAQLVTNPVRYVTKEPQQGSGTGPEVRARCGGRDLL